MHGLCASGVQVDFTTLTQQFYVASKTHSYSRAHTPITPSLHTLIHAPHNTITHALSTLAHLIMELEKGEVINANPFYGKPVTMRIAKCELLIEKCQLAMRIAYCQLRFAN